MNSLDGGAYLTPPKSPPLKHGRLACYGQERDILLALKTVYNFTCQRPFFPKPLASRIFMTSLAIDELSSPEIVPGNASTKLPSF